MSAFVVSGDEVQIAYLLPEPSGSKETTEPQQLTSPTNQTQSAGGPVYIRLPKGREKCPITGLSRAKLNELILPNERNNFSPQVALQESSTERCATRHPGCFVGELADVSVRKIRASLLTFSVDTGHLSKAFLM